MPQKKLDVLQLASRSMAEPSTGPSQIVWRQLRHANALGGFLHNVPNRLHRHAISPCPSNFVDPAEKFPSINYGLRRANRPVRFSPNQEPEPFGRGLPCQSDQQWPNALRAAGDDPTSTPRLHAASSRTRAAMRAMLGRVSFQSLMIGCLPKCLALLSSQPIAEAHSQLLHAFNTANARSAP